MKLCNSIDLAINYSLGYLSNTGRIVKSETWQGVKAPQPMFEAQDLAFKCPMPTTMARAVELIQPNLPWANDHFVERICGIPFNPPPSHEIWPFGQKNNKEFINNNAFDHTYPERFYPKYAGRIEAESPLETLDWVKNNGRPQMGIRFEYGDLNDVIQQLMKDPLTRQAYLPIFFPEDTGAKGGKGRVPCTLGYHFMIREGYLHIGYTMRSCDALRHFRDDLYMAVRLAQYVCEILTNKHETVKPGFLKFLAYSYHIFESEVKLLDKKIYNKG